MRIYLNEGWKFSEHFEASMCGTDYDTSQMEDVRIPHTNKEVPFHYFDEHEYQMICGYRKSFPAKEEWKNKRVFITFEGVAHSARVFINGREAASHHCGYTAFTVELTEDLFWDRENILAVEVDTTEQQNIPPFGFVVDYMTFGGIYRDVYMEIKEQAYISDIFVRADFEGDVTPVTTEARLLSTIEFDGGALTADSFYVRQFLLDGAREFLLGETKLCAGKNEIISLVKDITLWSPEQPKLYLLKTQLLLDGKVIDENNISFGFRKAQFRADGFYLNGVKTKIRGLNRHQSYPYVGYAMPKSMQRQDADILKKELGCNAVRTSHYPQSHYFVDECDSIGLLVFMEFPGWQYIGDEDWKEQALINLKEMIMQYRNHPSIILWGVRINESQDDDEFYRKTNEIAHDLDDSRQTGGVRAHKKSHLFEDVYTYNDFLHDGKTPGCDPKNKVTADKSKGYLISEYNGHMYPTKAYDWEEHRVEHALRHANVLEAVAGQEDIAGSFGWCMFDYNTHKDFGSGDRICYHGVMDMFRNPKLAAMVYACEQEAEPVLELSSTMDIGEHPGCNRGLTYIFTNADSVRMYKNNAFIKEYRASDSPYKNLRHGPIVIDDFIGEELAKNEPFTKRQADMLKEALNYVAMHGYHFPPRILWILIKCMVLYRMKFEDAVRLYNTYIGDWGGTSTVYRFEAIQDGQIVKRITKAPMTKAHLKIKASHTELREQNSYDVAEVRIAMLDENNNQLHFYNDPITLKTEGPIELIGPNVIPMQGGMTGAYIKTVGKSGKAALTIESTTGQTETVTFMVYI